MFPSLFYLELARTRHDELARHFARRQPRRVRGAARVKRLVIRDGAEASDEAVHFAHREAAGLTVDLYWAHREYEEAFRVEVVDRLSERRFTLHPTTGKEAIAAYHHPFAAMTSTGDSTGASATEAF